MKISRFEYGINTGITLMFSMLAFVAFYLVFGDTKLMWIAILLVGMPHFILSTLGFLASDAKRLLPQFAAAVLLGLVLTYLYYNFIPSLIAPVIFLAYFVVHMLSDEQMFEATIRKGGYKFWQNNWSTVISWGSIALVILAIVIASFYHLQLSGGYLLRGLWTVFFLLGSVVLVQAFREKRQGKNIPWQFLFMFVGVFIPSIFLFVFFWRGEAFAPPVFLALFHYISWYVFYGKRLALFPKKIVDRGLGERFLWGWRQDNRRFWLFIAMLQGFWLVIFLLYMTPPFRGQVSFLIDPYWAPFWTILHVTTSFIPARGYKFSFKFSPRAKFLISGN